MGCGQPNGQHPIFLFAIVLRRDIAFVAEEVAEAKRLELEVQNQVRKQWKADFDTFLAKFKK